MKTRITKTPLDGVLIVNIDHFEDERGFFIESWNRRDFAAAGVPSDFVQDSHSRSTYGVLRGLHYQDMRAPLAKLVRCTMGAIYDVAVDLRPQSPTFRDWIGVSLTAENRHMLYVPEGCGHGFLTLEDNTEVFYQMSEFYHPELARGVRWNDPAIRIVWPAAVGVISERDRTYADLGVLQCV